MKSKKTNNKSIAIAQILILIIGIVAISYAVGSSAKLVSADEDGGGCTTDEDCPDESICVETICVPIPSETPDPDQNDGAGLPDKPFDKYDSPPPPCGEGYTYTDANNFDNRYTAKKEDCDENGNAKSGSGLEKWLGGLASGVVSSIIQNKIGELIKGGTNAKGELTGVNGELKVLKKGGKNGGFFKGLFSAGSEKFAEGQGWTSLGQFAQIGAKAAAGSFVAWAIFKWIVKADVRNMREVFGRAVVGFGVGTGAGILAFTGELNFIFGTSLALGPAGWVAFGVALVLTTILSLGSFKSYSQEIFTYIVTAWKAPEGGEDCKLCNDLRYGCSEYQCRSFGQGCEIENAGTENEICVWKNPQDKFPPEITALEKVLPEPKEDYSYEPIDVVHGVKINYKKDSNGCIPPYTSVTLGVETNEFAECKIDLERNPDFDSMSFIMAKIEGFVKEHILTLPHVATPSVESQEVAGITEIVNGQAQEFYIRCKDVNGNYNEDEYIMEFCVQDGPDTSAPEILGTNYLETGFLQYNQLDAYLEVYTNEPAECKWSPEDLSYDAMQFEMNECSKNEGDYLFAGFGYGCKGTLTGLKNEVENEFYIRCKDKPWWTQDMEGQRYENQESFVLKLKGTKPLLIDKITANGKESGAKIKDATNTIKVKLEVTASAGAESGKARCAYKSGDNFINFYNDGNVGVVSKNTQNLFLLEGDYDIDIKCFDAGGNSAEDSIQFSVETDTDAPQVVRAYNDINNLRIITNEEASCVYSTAVNIACDYVFDDAEKMSVIGGTSHYTPWKENTKYFIKCKDLFGNYPVPGQCSAIVSTFG